MTTRLATVARHGVRVPGTSATLALVAVALAGLVVLRLRSMHPGLLYPDGYQYLLMARGIGEHLAPVATLGHGGDTVAPNADASVKPLFPALVALMESLGFAPVDAARAVAALAGAAVAPLAGLVTLRLGASRAGALLAAFLCLASPTLGFWFGFAGPDALAVALALGAAAALLTERPLVGGALAGLAITTRPELLVPVLAFALAAIVSRRTRTAAVRASSAALLTVAIVVGVLRPPIPAHTLLFMPAALALGCLGAAAVVLAERASRRACLAAAVGLTALLALALVHGDAWGSTAGRDWPLFVLAGLGLVIAPRRRTTLRIAVALLLLAPVYLWKNPGSDRYTAMLLPLFAVLAGLGAVRLRPILLAAAAALALVPTVVAPTPSVGPDEFATVAAQLEHAPAGPLMTAAPDAYGVLMPGRPVRAMRVGTTGLVVVDAAARAYEPDLRVAGTLLARIQTGDGFLRPDGHLDTAPALLYRGRVYVSSR